MARFQCNKCSNVFEVGFSGIASVHIGPYHLLKCPACKRRGWFNIYSSVGKPITWPIPEKTQDIEIQLTEESEEKKRIEDSKFERN